MENNLNTRNCDQCEAIHINGTLCHETGCSESWRTVSECKWCGSEYMPHMPGQGFCEQSCVWEYHGMNDPFECTICDDCDGEIAPGGDCETCAEDDLTDTLRDIGRGIIAEGF